MQSKMHKVGFVSLVGAGPGDFELITVKGERALTRADVLIYDRLVAKALILKVPFDCEKIYVGKKASEHTLTQEAINALLIEKAKEGKRVVRLKGGDPYVFGRGGEEGEALYEASIPFEVIPGISSAIGGLAYAGIPITHRHHASSFHVITGHLKEGEEDHNWEAIAHYEGTLVFLMGVSQLNHIASSLIRFGKSPQTPSAVVEWATTTKQRKLVTTLEALHSDAVEKGFKSPSVIVVGEVVLAHKKLDFITQKPLFGKKIAVTRGRDQASRLVDELRNLGADVVETPMIQISPLFSPEIELTFAHDTFQHFTHVVFTSANGVMYTMKALDTLGFDARAFHGKQLTVIGSATKEALASYGIRADYMPDTYLPEALVRELGTVLTKNDYVLVPRAKHGRVELIEALSGFCAVKELHLYESVLDHTSHLSLETFDKLDYITFTSSSTVKNFFELYGKEEATRILKQVVAVTIGPLTSETLMDYTITNYIQAAVHTVSGLVDRLLEETTSYD